MSDGSKIVSFPGVTRLDPQLPAAIDEVLIEFLESLLKEVQEGKIVAIGATLISPERNARSVMAGNGPLLNDLVAGATYLQSDLVEMARGE